MIAPPAAASEERRLSVLNALEILDTLPEKSYDDLTLIAAEICATPIALISLVDQNRQWFKSKIGIDATQTSRDISFCGHAILSDELFVVNNAEQDARFYDNPLVQESPHIKFYAGAPLITRDGENIGTLCVIDRVPRGISDSQKNCLLALSRQVITLLELRLALQENREAAAAKSLFLANMSHEIRTPMNAVTSCTNLLIDMIHEPEQVKLLKLIRNAGSGLTALINDILDLSKLDIESVALCESPFDLHKLSKEVVSILGIRASHDNHSIHLDIGDSVPQWILGDANRLRQMLYNLAGNALKFCSRRVGLRLSTVKHDKLDRLLIEVRDDGKGIPKEQQQQIFRRYAQVDDGTQGRDSGTGLGLTICRSICQAMQGRIWVDSSPGNGATFSIELPLQVAQPLADSDDDLTLTDITDRLNGKLPLRVLVAEDSDVNRFIIKSMLDKLVYHTDLVADGNEAFEACQKEAYDLILMDIQMPNLDGNEATRKIRASSIKQPAIIALTANAFGQDKAAALAAGMNGFITKPINFEALANELRLLTS